MIIKATMTVTAKISPEEEEFYKGHSSEAQALLLRDQEEGIKEFLHENFPTGSDITVTVEEVME